MKEKTYTISEVSRMLNIPVSTLRYYDSKGLLPGMARKESGYREFTQRDIENLKLIRCFKLAGMSIKDIHQYFVWAEEGDSTLEQRYHLIQERHKAIDKQIQVLEEQKRIVDRKAAWYEEKIQAARNGQKSPESC